jgi:hypothetical protein
LIVTTSLVVLFTRHNKAIHHPSNFFEQVVLQNIQPKAETITKILEGYAVHVGFTYSTTKSSPLGEPQPCFINATKCKSRRDTFLA